MSEAMQFASPDWYEMVVETMYAMCREELNREPDPAFVVMFMYHAREQGWNDVQIREEVRKSQEWTDKHPPVPEPPVYPIPSLLLRDGRRILEGGRVYHVREVTAFLLLYRYLNGEDILPFLSWARSIGANTLRVLGMVKWPSAQLVPDHYARYPERVRAFIDFCGQQGFRVEFVVFADAQKIIPDPAAQQRHLDDIREAIRDAPNALIELANEPFKNGVDPVKLHLKPTVGLASRGSHQSSKDAYTPPLDYITLHTTRDGEWVRKAKHGLEVSHAFERPVILNEPMGAGDAIGSGRSNVPEDFFWYFAIAGMQSAGSCFHFHNGLHAQLPSTRQENCARAAAQAWDLVDPIWQTGSYTAGHLSACPIDGEGTLRVYASIRGNEALAVAVRPNASWNPKTRGDWKITRREGPLGTLIWLKR